MIDRTELCSVVRSDNFCNDLIENGDSNRQFNISGGNHLLKHLALRSGDTDVTDGLHFEPGQRHQFTGPDGVPQRHQENECNGNGQDYSVLSSRPVRFRTSHTNLRLRQRLPGARGAAGRVWLRLLSPGPSAPSSQTALVK